MKSFISIFVLVFLSIIPIDTFAEKNEFTVQSVEGVVIIFHVLDMEDKTCEVRGVESGSDVTKLTIPTVANDYKVVAIGNKAFYNMSNLTDITLPNSVMTIGSQAFQYCTKLKDIALPDSVITIGELAFENCKFVNIILPNSLTAIGSQAFQYCTKLTDIAIPNSISVIEKSTFYGCTSLTNVSIPSSVIDIGDGAFNGCSNLSGIMLPNSIKSIGHGAFRFTNIKEVTIPSSVTTIGSYAFANCSNLTSLIIPNTITNIADGMVYGCNSLESFTIPSSVTSIGSGVFRECSNLSAITIPNSVITIGTEVFKNCPKLTEVSIPNSVTTIGSQAFYECTGLKTITLSNSLSAIAQEMFYYCRNLASVDIPNSVINVYNNAFYACERLASITFANSETAIGQYAFAGCKSLTSIELPDSLTSIPSYVFSSCTSLTSITFPNCLTSIGTEAFAQCTNLDNIKLPLSLIRIESGAFEYCTSLTSIEIPVSVKALASTSFEGCYNLQRISVDADNKYFDSRGGCNAIIETSTNKLLKGCDNTVIPNTVNIIGEYAFYQCKKLSKVDIPNSVNSIHYSAFANCKNLTDVIIPNSVTSIGSCAFEYCSELKNVNIPEMVTTLPFALFRGCYSLTSLFIPNSVTAIGEQAFKGCNNLKDVNIPDFVESIYREAFFNCAITSITLPNSLRGIDYYAFTGCNKLATVYSEIETPFELTYYGPFDGNLTIYIPFGTNKLYKEAGWERPGRNQSLVEIDVFKHKTAEGIEVTFKGINSDERTCQVGEGNNIPAFDDVNVKYVTIPQTVKGCSVIGAAEGAFSNSSLAALIWDADATIQPSAFSASTTNPNLLLYVKKGIYAPENINNVIVNGTAEIIHLSDAAEGNDFYCPLAFTAKYATYEHDYTMTSGFNECRGWETLTLPFNVSNITNPTGSWIVPFGVWDRYSGQQAFWLYTLTENGWQAETTIKAYTPYIICMPNNDNEYLAKYIIKGKVIFEGINVEIDVSDHPFVGNHGTKKLIPSFQNQTASDSIYALNVNNQLDKYEQESPVEGSTFISGLRRIRPFEAYMSVENEVQSPRFLPINDLGIETGLMGLPLSDKSEAEVVSAYSLSGQLVKEGKYMEVISILPNGIYIIDSKKILIKK